MLAAGGGYIEVVEVLTNAGADVNLKGAVSCWSQHVLEHIVKNKLLLECAAAIRGL